MNRKERMAAAILVATLAAGVLVDVFGPEPLGEGRRGDPGESAVAVGTDSAEVVEGQSPIGGGADSAAKTCAGEARAGGSPEDVGYLKIDVNRAGMDELMLLPGIGPKKAEAVVEWRTKRGRFRSLDDLLEVRGIGKATLERLRPYAEVRD